MLTPPRRNNKKNILNVVFIFLIFSQPSVCSAWMMWWRVSLNYMYSSLLSDLDLRASSSDNIISSLDTSGPPASRSLGRIDLIGFGWIWLDLVGFDWTWLDLVWIWFGLDFDIFTNTILVAKAKCTAWVEEIISPPLRTGLYKQYAWGYICSQAV